MKISKNILLFGLAALAIVSTIISCGNKDKEEKLIGNWIELADFIADARSEAVAFSIGEIGYVGTGYNGEDRLADFCAYDVNANNWSFIADPPADFSARTGAVAFAIGNKGYVGTGRNDTARLSDFWEYDKDQNKWTKLANNYPSARYGAVAFAINGKGYVGTGYDGSPLLDFYEFDPSTGDWTLIANYPTKVRDAAAFVLGNKGYVVTGEKNGVAIEDFFAYDPSQNSWETLKKISNNSDASYDDKYAIVRKNAVAFTIGGKGYVTTGDHGGLKSDVWEYDATADQWTSRTAFEGSPRNNAVAFTTQSGRSFVTTGVNGSTSYYDDLFEFEPDQESNDED